jgi:spore coat polysaccharide biosynthesis protein SpsF
MIYTRPDRFDCLGVSTLLASADLRATVDTAADLTAVRAIVAELGTAVPSAHQIVALLRDRPDLVALNSSVMQKALSEG